MGVGASAGVEDSGGGGGGDGAATVVRTAKKVLDGCGGLSLLDLVAHVAPRSVMLRVSPMVTRSALARTVRWAGDAVEGPAELPSHTVSVLGLPAGPDTTVEARVGVDGNTATRGYLTVRWRNPAVPGFTTLAINPYTVHLLGCRSRFSVLRSGEEVRDRFGRRVGVVDRLQSPGTLMFEHDDMPGRQVAAEVDLYLEMEDEPGEAAGGGSGGRTHLVFIVPTVVERYVCVQEPTYSHVFRVKVPVLPMLAFLRHVSGLPATVLAKRREMEQQRAVTAARPAALLPSPAVAAAAVVVYVHCGQCGTRDAAYKCPCGSVRYCSKACQATHWQGGHKDACGARKRSAKK